VDLPDEQTSVVMDTSEAAWGRALERAKQVHNELVEAVKFFPHERLSEKVPGKKKQPDWYDYYYMLQAWRSTKLYHAGQIALLKKAG